MVCHRIRGRENYILKGRILALCPAVHATLAGPRTAGEVEGNIRHATTELPADTWEDLDYFVADLQPPASPGGESA